MRTPHVAPNEIQTREQQKLARQRAAAVHQDLRRKFANERGRRVETWRRIIPLLLLLLFGEQAFFDEKADARITILHERKILGVARLQVFRLDNNYSFSAI